MLLTTRMTNLLILRIMKYAFKSYDEALEIVIKEINLKLKVAEVLKSKTCSSFCSVSKYFVSFFCTRKLDQVKRDALYFCQEQEVLQKTKRIENPWH